MAAITTLHRQLPLVMHTRCAFRVLHTFRFIRPKPIAGATPSVDAWSECISRITAQQASLWALRDLLSGVIPDVTRVEDARAVGRASPRYDVGDSVGPVGGTEDALVAFLNERDDPANREDIAIWETAGAPSTAPIHAFYRTELLHAAQQSLFGGHGSDTTYLRLSPTYIERVFNDGNHQGTVPPAIAMQYWQELDRTGCRKEEGGIAKPQPRHGMRGSFLSIYESERTTIDNSAAASAPTAKPRESEPAHRRLATCTPISALFCPAELWLSPYGIGVLSLNFDVTLAREGESELRRLVYALSMSNSQRSPWLVFGRVDNWVAIDAHHLRRLTPHERIGVPNQALRLTDLRDVLLQSLTDGGLEVMADAEQRRHLVYSVVRRVLPAGDATTPGAGTTSTPRESSDADDGNPERLAIALAQTEEESHPGMPVGADSPLPCAWINAATVAAVSDQGAARVVLDQPVEKGSDRPHGFNYERYQRNRDRSFVVYLAALQQRLVLERIRGSVAAAVAASRTTSLHSVRTAVEQDHRDLLDFAASGMLAVVSTRDSYNRWYELSRKGNRVDRHYDALQQVMNSLDHSAQLEAQRQENEHAAKSLAVIADIQQSLRAENERSSQSLEVIAEVQKAARESGDRARFLEAMLVAVSGVQFWFLLADRSNVNYWYAIVIGTMAYVASLRMAFDALRVSDAKRTYYVLAGILMVGLAVIGKYFLPTPPAAAVPSTNATSTAPALPTGTPQSSAAPRATVVGSPKNTVAGDSARGIDSAARGARAPRRTIVPDSVRPHQ